MQRPRRATAALTGTFPIRDISKEVLLAITTATETTNAHSPV